MSKCGFVWWAPFLLPPDQWGFSVRTSRRQVCWLPAKHLGDHESVTKVLRPQELRKAARA